MRLATLGMRWISKLAFGSKRCKASVRGTRQQGALIGGRPRSTSAGVLNGQAEGQRGSLFMLLKSPRASFL
jgi:hypothetical protein